MAGAIKPHDIKRVFILYVRQDTIQKRSHQTTIKQRSQTRRGLSKINGQNETEKRITTGRWSHQDDQRQKRKKNRRQTRRCQKGMMTVSIRWNKQRWFYVTAEKGSTGRGYAIETEEVIRLESLRVPFGWWLEGKPEGRMWKGPGKHFCLTEALTHFLSKW